MEISNPILSAFISDFKLKKAVNGNICFDAVIQYRSKENIKQLETEIHIVTIDKKHLTIFFLLNPDIIVHQLPDTLIFNSYNFKYHKNISLTVYAYDNVIGPYAVTIQPINKSCAEETIYELRAKKLN